MFVRWSGCSPFTAFILVGVGVGIKVFVLRHELSQRICEPVAQEAVELEEGVLSEA